MDNIIIILLVIISLLLAYIIFNKLDKQEDFATDLEAIANIASLYNTSNFTVTNANITGALSVGSLNILPKGIIVAWTGRTPPAGWALCDGTKIGDLQTPDLRGRFILGAMIGTNQSNTYTQSAVPSPTSDYWGYGGEEKVTLTVDQMPAHAHTVGNVTGGWIGNNADRGGDISAHDNPTLGTYPTNSVGGGQPHNNIPPYWVLAYIIKL